MRRIIFDFEGLSRIRLVASAGPVAETVFALEMVGKAGSVPFGGWLHRVNAQLGERSKTIRTITRTMRPIPDLLWTLEAPLRPGDDLLATVGLSSREILSAVHDFCQTAVMPNWRRMRIYLEAERDTRGRILSTGGVERLLSTLHPQIRWNPPVLEIPSERDDDVSLNGRTLLLAPSLFMVGKPAVLIDANRANGQPILSFAAPPDFKAANELWGQHDHDGQALSALIGKTRATVLMALTDSSTTTGDLAVRLGISAAAVSQHTGVLRAAGLINTRRNRNMVLHTLTTLGGALLSGHSMEALAPTVDAAV